MSRRLILLLLVLAGALAGGYVFYYAYPQRQLDLQLQELDYALTLENTEQTTRATYFLTGLKAEVAKNRNAPADMQVLRRAENLNTCFKTLQDTLQATRARLRRATANPRTPARLTHPGATAGLAVPQSLRRVRLACADTLHRLGAAATLPQLPDFVALPVVNALASLTQFESEALAAQASALQRLSRSVGARQLVARPVAIATAESNMVSPGDTYRAQLLMVSALTGLRPPMTCNGQPIFVDRDGIGQVRFRAPTRPGPATWTGTIRFNQNGRDTTFKVTVPYRVVRR
jgi:hypothetical protein